MTNSPNPETGAVPTPQGELTTVAIEYSETLKTISYLNPDGTEANTPLEVNYDRSDKLELLAKLAVNLGPGTHSIESFTAATGLTGQRRGAAINGLQSLVPEGFIALYPTGKTAASKAGKKDYLRLGNFSVQSRVPQADDSRTYYARLAAENEAKLKAADERKTNFEKADHAVVTNGEETWVMPLDTPEGIMAARLVREITLSKNGTKLSIQEIRTKLLDAMPRNERRLCTNVDVGEAVKQVGEQITVKGRPITSRAYLSSRIQEFTNTDKLTFELDPPQHENYPDVYDSAITFLPASAPVIEETPKSTREQRYAALASPVVVSGEINIDQNAGRPLPSVDMIPSIQDSLKSISLHGDEQFTPDYNVADELEFINETPDGPHTPNQLQLLDDLRRLTKYSDTPAFELRFMKPGELHGLVEKLDLLAAKNRPDFDEIEGQLLDFFRNQQDSHSLTGIIKRADMDAPGRRGMTWDNMVRLAKSANLQLQDRNRSDTVLKNYSIAAKDPKSGVYPDLSAVFQFVINMHSMEVYSSRSGDIAAANATAFEDNCRVINEWLESTKGTMTNLPNTLKLERKPAAWLIKEHIQTMNLRLISEDKFGKFKAYSANPMGALSLQLRIAHLIDELRTVLETGIVTTEEDIIPLV